MLNQEKLSLKIFCTITITGFLGTEYEGFNCLGRIRSKLNPYLARRTKYVGLAVLKNKYDLAIASLELTPHFHYLISDTIDIKLLGDFLKEKFPEYTFRFHCRIITNIRRVTNYLLDQNYFKCAEIKFGKFRIMSASKGIYLGRPKYPSFNNIYDQLAAEGL